MKQQQLIDQIHNEFDTAQDRLLQQANEILNKPVDMKETAIESIGERLKKVGFVNVPTAKKSEEIKTKKNATIKQLVETREQAELIEYYKRSYPFLKFLTESELDRICEKYNLVYAPAANYIEEVPEKNLRDIETAQELKEVDLCPIQHKLIGGNDFMEFLKSIGKTDNIFYEGEDNDLCKKFAPNRADRNYWGFNSNTWTFVIWDEIGRRGNYIFESVERFSKEGLFIAAPSSHFETKNLTKKGFGFFNITRTEVKDPIVFRYVKGGIQVITKWGLEASDPALVVPILN